MTKNTTDTNQASEDELVRKAILKILHQTESCTGCKDHYKKPHKCDMDLAAPRCVKRVRKLEALIRTEKLKLLATIGQPTLDDVGLMQPEQYEGGVIINDWYKNRLAELEAEL